MLCDPLQKSSLVCPDTFCPNTNITFSVCEYDIAKNSNNQTAFTYNGCADTSSLSCDSFKACALLNIYIMQHGINQTSAAVNETKYVSRCAVNAAVGGSTAISNGTASSSATAANATSVGSIHEAACSSILLFICLLTISMSKRLF